jgi:CobQ-like glutamine amidotransferase family enzyme
MVPQDSGKKPGRKKSVGNVSKSLEGIQYKNLLGTYLTGPILIRNPPLLKYFTDRMDI